MMNTVNNPPFHMETQPGEHKFGTKMSLDVNTSEPEEFVDVEIHNCLREVAKAKGIDNFDYNVEFACGKGDNYVANLFRVLIKDTEKTENNISVIVKTLVKTSRQDTLYELHKREVAVYNEVIPIFETIQHNLGDDKVILPKCLYSNAEKGKEILILEDLVAQGFSLDKKLMKFEKLDYLQVRLVLTELAKFHSLSFICEEKKNESFDKLKGQFDDIIFEKTFLHQSKLNDYFLDCYEMSLKVINNLDAKEKLEQVKSKLLSIMRKYVQPSKYNVLCHGDCWINNILFKHQEMKPSQACFLDFQAMSYASPVLDIIHFLYICTDSAFRFEHLDTLLTVYHESLKCALRINNIDVKKVYPIEEFENDFQEHLPFGLLIALLELRLVKSDNDDTPKLKGSNFGSVLDLSEEVETSNLFELAINDVVNESIENRVLDKLVDEIKNIN